MNTNSNTSDEVKLLIALMKSDRMDKIPYQSQEDKIRIANEAKAYRKSQATFAKLRSKRKKKNR